MKVIVIGGGASGLIAAITAKECGHNVTILEKNKKLLEKVSITGNGRANLSNANINPDNYTGDRDLVKNVLSKYSVDFIKDYFLKLGLITTTINDCIYPYSQQATSLVDVLRNKATKVGVVIKTDNEVRSVSKVQNQFVVDTGYDYKCDKLIIATGGRSYESTGSTGDGYVFAKALGHNIVHTEPGLVPLVVDDVITKAAGVRVNCSISYNNKSEVGQLQITNYGISGIIVFNISNIIKDGESVSIDFVPEYSTEDVEKYLSELSSNNVTALNCLDAFFNKKLSNVFLNKCNIKADVVMDENQIREISNTIKNYQLSVERKLGYYKAQITVGGVDASEINHDTLQSNLVEGLYFAGEVLNVNGICGGFNLHFAWASGHRAGLLK